ncbi:MAG: M23 family metallopeptidase [Thermodesulfobacteriota bacterium]
MPDNSLPAHHLPEWVYRARRILLWLLLLGSVVSLALFLTEKNRDLDDDLESSASRIGGPALGLLDPGPFQTEADRWPNLTTVIERFSSGDTAAKVLARLGLSRGEAHQVIQAARAVKDLTKLPTGGEMILFREKATGLPARIEYRGPSGERLALFRTPAGYAAALFDYEPLRQLNAVEGVIKSTLWGSAVKLYRLEPKLVMTLADIFAYDIDFLTDIQEGDSFRLLYEEQYLHGRPAGHGRILAAEFINKNKNYEAFHYQDRAGNDGYYDATGRHLKKMFLKSPLQYSRITSYFSYARLHPITKIVRPHEGVDYAAPLGTPVDALGDGVITKLGWYGGYGNFIEIKHNKTYGTTYGHLSGYAKGLKKGDRVKQGQLIGFVGSTGLSTGPHLDFRVMENGKFIDPLSMKLQPAAPISPGEKTKFLVLAAQRQEEMSNLLAHKD